MPSLKLLVVLFFLGGIYEISRAESSIYIKDNAYQQIVVLIGDKVHENWDLVDKIKEVFYDASGFLYYLTKERAYFGNISIVIPRSWNSSWVTHNLTYETSKDVWIDAATPPGFNVPYTKGLSRCGRPGSFIKLTADYMLDEAVAADYGPYEKLIAHEWSHLRYGVFDEYAYSNQPKFYLNMDNKYEAVKCSRAIKGYPVNAETGGGCRMVRGKPEPNCVYNVDMSGEAEGYASVMFMQHYDQITEYCDNSNEAKTQHNRYAPNRQNRLCRQRSIWEVLDMHEDFKNERNPPRDVETVKPEYRIVQRDYPRTVLVLDVSGSMDENNRIQRLGRACRHFIKQAPDGYRVAIVEFSTDARIKLDMTELNDQTRQTAINAIPTNPDGWTAIGKGILLGLQILRNSGGSEGANLVVVSDGGENRAPFIDDITQEVLDSEVIVDSISISDGAETKVDRLADLTRGFKAHFSESSSSTALIDAFSALANTGIEDPADRKQSIVSEAVTLLANNPRSASVYIDNTVGKNTVFTFEYESQSPNIKITDPDGIEYGTATADLELDSATKTWEFKPSGTTKAGSWTYELTSSVTQDISVTIVTERSSESVSPYVIEAEWGLNEQDGGQNEKQVIYITVSQGNYPVLDAEVTAVVDLPEGADPVQVTCKDNGAGADNAADDGVYSAYFLGQNANGRYNLKATAKGTAATRVDKGSIAGVGSLNILQSYSSQETTGQFQRITAGGTFQVTNYQHVTYPPDAVSDLELEEVDYNSKMVTFTWTATGSQADSGQALGYEMRYSFHSEEFEQNFTTGNKIENHMVSGSSNLTHPKLAGEKERMHVILNEKEGTTCVFGIKVLGTHGTSETSNLILVPLEEPTFAELAPQSVNVLAIVLGVLIPVLLIAIIAVIVFIFWKKRILATKTPSGGDKADQQYDNPACKA